MNIINNNTYTNLNFSNLGDRDLAGNLLSLSGSNNNILDERFFIEIPAEQSKNLYELGIIDFDFKELSTDDVPIGVNIIPSGMILISGSIYDNLLEQNLNLQNDIEFSSSVYNVELQLIQNEKSSLYTTFKSINKSVINILNVFIDKYLDNTGVSSDIKSVKMMLSQPTDYIEYNSASLVNTTLSFNDNYISVEGGVSASQVTKNIEYNLLFNDVELTQIFKDRIDYLSRFSDTMASPEDFISVINNIRDITNTTAGRLTFKLTSISEFANPSIVDTNIDSRNPGDTPDDSQLTSVTIGQLREMYNLLIEQNNKINISIASMLP